MTQEDKELLLKDLCARLPYGVMVACKWKKDAPNGSEGFVAKLSFYELEQFCNIDDDDVPFNKIKPFLRFMDSMTEKEKAFYKYHNSGYCYAGWAYPLIDWLNAHHFDYRGLIKKGLALEAPEGMYKD